MYAIYKGGYKHLCPEVGNKDTAAAGEEESKEDRYEKMRRGYIGGEVQMVYPFMQKDALMYRGTIVDAKANPDYSPNSLTSIERHMFTVEWKGWRQSPFGLWKPMTTHLKPHSIPSNEVTFPAVNVQAFEPTQRPHRS